MASNRTGKRRRAAGTPNPLAAMVGVQREFARLGWRFGEMTTAASAVIAARSARLARATGNPVLAADAEFVRMVSEKAEAFQEAAAALATHRPRRRPSSAHAAAHGLTAAAELANACLSPYWRRTRANARRLGRRAAAR